MNYEASWDGGQTWEEINDDRAREAAVASHAIGWNELKRIIRERGERGIPTLFFRLRQKQL